MELIESSWDKYPADLEEHYLHIRDGCIDILNASMREESVGNADDGNRYITFVFKEKDCEGWEDELFENLRKLRENYLRYFWPGICWRYPEKVRLSLVKGDGGEELLQFKTRFCYYVPSDGNDYGNE